MRTADSSTARQDSATSEDVPQIAGDSASTPSKSAVRLHERKSVRQFVKFCIVGVSSFVVNFGVFNALYHYERIDLIPALSIAFFISVFNGFFWNRQWTFKEKRGRSAANQYTKFLLVNIVGWLLNTGITVALIAAYMSHVSAGVQFNVIFLDIIQGAKEHYPKLLTNGALLGATGVVVFWNFFANRHWTFKH